MQDNDLSDVPTRRYWTTSDVVIQKVSGPPAPRRWRRRSEYHWALDSLALNLLWRWSYTLPVRMELLFLDDRMECGHDLWEMIDRASSNPFNDYLMFHSRQEALNSLNYRPDVLGVIDIPDLSSMWGSSGLTLNSLP